MNQINSLETTDALTKLIRLQELEGEASSLQQTITQAPEKVALLDEKLKEAFQSVEDAESNITDSGQRRRQLEGSVESLREKLAHYKSQLMEVKTNTAYQAMLHEISFVEKSILEKEDEILEQMLEADELDARLKEAKKNFEEQKKTIEEEKSLLEADAAEAKKGLEGIQEEIDSVRSAVPVEFMERYNRIAAARGGVAMAPVVNHSCEACHVRLRPQLLAEVRANRQVILCENCSRILFFVSS